MDSAERTAMVEAYRTSPLLIREALRGIDDSFLDQRPPGGEWSIREIGHHIVDAEVMAAARLRQLLAERAPSIQPYDEAEFARRLHYERPLDSALDLLAASRNANADLLEVLEDADWKRQGTHPDLSAYTVEYLVRRAVEHCSQHAQQIGRAFAAIGGAQGDRHERWMERLRREGSREHREYQLLVQLRGISPKIWRRLVVPDAILLPRLHQVLQVAFGWQDHHMHIFEVGTARFSEPDEEDELGHLDERRVRINQLLHQPGDRCRYEYDLGDSWEHEVLLEDMWAEPEEPKGPRCLAGERAAPPEDCGGTPGYERLIAALSDPSHEEHEDFRIWAGPFSPESFDLDAVNHQLARLRRGRQRAGGGG